MRPVATYRIFTGRIAEQLQVIEDFEELHREQKELSLEIEALEKREELLKARCKHITPEGKDAHEGVDYHICKYCGDVI